MTGEEVTGPRAVLTRDGALAALTAALPRLGGAYAAGRNFAPAADQPPVTARLSAYLSRRLLGEWEVIAAAHRAHGGQAMRFVEQVGWRTYFKGYLQQHPEIWPAFKAGLAVARARLAAEPGLARDYASACAGATGIACFDAWVRALGESGYLHNHERMWFASIWIFTLHLPWELGAALFLRQLVDADAAANTLSWRWVAGLHTRGKHYLARAENIARYTEGRFAPHGQLNETAEALREAPIASLPPRLAPAPAAQAGGPMTLLLHGEDGLAASLFARGEVGRVVVLMEAELWGLRVAMDAAMAADVAQSAAARFGVAVERAGDCAQLAQLCAGQMVCGAMPMVGVVEDALRGSGLAFAWRQHAWDGRAWPACGRGYFGFRQVLERGIG